MKSTQNNTLIETVYSFFDRYGIDAGTPILIALSCGVDSIVLTHVLSVVCAERNVPLGCCHINHGIRGTSEGEEDYKLAKKTAEQFGLPFFYRKIGSGYIRQTAQTTGRSEEEVAREERYKMLSAILEREKYTYLAVAHHLDDQIETVTMRFFQGAGAGGLAGMEPVREAVIRPFLGHIKEEIVRYAEAKDLRYRTDVTNSSQNYLRNQVRHRLLPVVEAIFPGYRSSLSVLSEKMTRLERFIEREAEERVPWRECDGGYTVPAETFFTAPPVLRIESVYRVFNKMFSDENGFRLPHRFLTPLTEGKSSQRTVLLRGYGIVLRHKGDQLECLYEVAEEGKKNYLIKTQKDVYYKIGKDNGFRMTEMILSSIMDDSIVIKKKDVVLPLIVRSRRPGDVLEGREGKKPLKKLFNEWQIPEEDRWKIPVIEDRNGIIALAGKPFGYKNRVADKWNRSKIDDEEKVYLFSFN